MENVERRELSEKNQIKSVQRRAGALERAGTKTVRVEIEKRIPLIQQIKAAKFLLRQLQILHKKSNRL